MGVLFISLAVSLDTQKNGADINGKTAGMELLFFGILYILVLIS